MCKDVEPTPIELFTVKWRIPIANATNAGWWERFKVRLFGKHYFTRDGSLILHNVRYKGKIYMFNYSDLDKASTQ